MNNTLINFSSDPQQLLPLKDTPTIQVIVFGIGQLNLALRVESIYKVLKQTQVHSSGLGDIGIAHIGDREVTVLDLQRQLFQTSSLDTQAMSCYLIVATKASGELVGIPVDLVPTLLEVPIALVRVLPASYRQADTLGIASHVAVIPQESGSLTLFLVDIEQLL
ncbi:MAG: chemotaxis protein CheW [Leptolyngbyaceae bacterium]|nr:chemotaxis protein CheW [Leptolyngbyaceae bacterium]